MYAQLRNVLSEQVRSGVKEIEILSWMSRAAMEYIGQGGFGYTFDALEDGKRNSYNEDIRGLS